MKREKLSSRLGFLLLSAGCAIGLGNVWRFPYITGKYGGAVFFFIYLFFLVILGLPVMVMEFSVGRASQKSLAKSFDELEPKNTKWHLYKYLGMTGNYLLMMFYTTIAGWMLAFFVKSSMGTFQGMNSKEVSSVFTSLTNNPLEMIMWMAIVVIFGMGIVSLGVKNGVEKVSKYMMTSLLVLMSLLAIYALSLPNAMDGLSFYLKPDFNKVMEIGLGEVIYNAMGQAFFTLSLGMGSLAIFGSYLGKERSLLGESINVCILDTFVAFIAGLIIFPACFSLGVQPDSGPNLIFVTLPGIFNQLPMGTLWGSLFFLFMSFAAFTTVIAVFENLIAFWIDFGVKRNKAVWINLILVLVLSLPCILGFNLLSDIHPLGGSSTILDLEDFIVSNNLLPFGSLIYVLFCTHRYGWGWKSFIQECNTGKGIKFPVSIRFYISYILPVIIIFILISGYIIKFIPA